MDRTRLAVRVTDIERVLDQCESPVLGNNFRATLPAGRVARLLVSLQGQDIISMSALESIAHQQAHINALELQKAYLPLFSEWGFLRVYTDRVEENITSRSVLLEKVGKWWEESNPSPTEKLAVDLFDKAAMSPIPADTAEKIMSNYTEKAGTIAMVHLSQSGLVDKFNYNDAGWFYSPEVFGENYPTTIKYLENQTTGKRAQIWATIEKVLNDEGLPHDTLKTQTDELMINQITGAGLLMGYPLSISGKNCPFYFTPDVRNRYDREGRGDKFELIKSGVAHFQYAHRLAELATGKLKFSPSVLLDKLLENGNAGNATAIGTDYDLLLKKGLIKIEPTQSGRYRFILPTSKEKIADLEAIRDAFKEKWIVPQIDISSMGIPCKVIPGDSIVYRSTRAIQAKSLTQEFAAEIFKL